MSVFIAFRSLAHRMLTTHDFLAKVIGNQKCTALVCFGDRTASINHVVYFDGLGEKLPDVTGFRSSGLYDSTIV